MFAAFRAMSTLAHWSLLSLAVLCQACESEPAGMTPDPFVGRWTCAEQDRLTITSQPSLPPQVRDEMKTMTVTSANGQITALTRNEGGTSGCPVVFTASGATATLVEGQSCPTPIGVTGTYKNGTATVSGNTLTASVSYEGAGTVAIDGAPVMVMGTGTTDYTCSRMTPPPGPGGSGTGGW
jgi:hypothetical protein